MPLLRFQQQSQDVERRQQQERLCPASLARPRRGEKGDERKHGRTMSLPYPQHLAVVEREQGKNTTIRQFISNNNSYQATTIDALCKQAILKYHNILQNRKHGGISHRRLVSSKKLTNDRSREAKSLSYISKTLTPLLMTHARCSKRQLEIVSLTRNSRNQRSQEL